METRKALSGDGSGDRFIRFNVRACTPGTRVSGFTRSLGRPLPDTSINGDRSVPTRCATLTVPLALASIAEYSGRQVLLDLGSTELEMAAFDGAALDAGRVDGGLFAVNAGINAPVLLTNPDVFEATGTDLPGLLKRRRTFSCQLLEESRRRLLTP